MIVWQPYLIAIVIGLFVGIERERAHPFHKTMGVRTFLLISLLGAIAGGLREAWLAGVIALFAAALIVVSYFTQTTSKETSVDRGLTTEFAAGIVFCLGYVAHQAPVLSIILGPVVALILFSKLALHRFTHVIKTAELEAALLLFLSGVLIVNIVPDAPVDPWGVANPKKFALLVLTIAILEFSSYVLVKLIGERKGSLTAGFLGGLVSSTAVLMSSARQAQATPEAWRSLFCAALASKLAAFIELLIIVGMVAPNLLGIIAPVVLAALAVGGFSLYITARKAERSTGPMALRSPLDWRGVLRLSVMLGLILVVISFAKLMLGEAGTFAVSFLTGLFELHGVSLANATMYSQGVLNARVASLSIVLAVISSLIAKIFISWTVHRGTFSRAISISFGLMIGAAVLAAILTMSYAKMAIQ